MHSTRAARFLGWTLVLALAAGLAGGCHRNTEPFDPDEKVVQPDLSRIFPEGAERAADNPEGGLAGSAGPAPPPAPARGAEAGAGSDAPPLRGTIRVANALEGRVPPGAILFLIARTGPGGPPTAVQRVVDPSFPLDFELGPDDRMIQSLPFQGPFRLSARIDADRNAMTRNPGDLAGEADGTYEPGARDIELVIDEVL
ncbi:MAG: hypothetical protein CL910_09850 [Deltaproteobacteria bacterium]|jgi:hypothetical protein|nr:hypothetical protein [Deltaproteobacteria bacterium]